MHVKVIVNSVKKLGKQVFLPAVLIQLAVYTNILRLSTLNLIQTLWHLICAIAYSEACKTNCCTKITELLNMTRSSVWTCEDARYLRNLRPKSNLKSIYFKHLILYFIIPLYKILVLFLVVYQTNEHMEILIQDAI